MVAQLWSRRVVLGTAGGHRIEHEIGPLWAPHGSVAFSRLSQDPQPLDRRLSDGTLRAGKRLPRDRRVLDLTLRARVRRR